MVRKEMNTYHYEIFILVVLARKLWLRKVSIHLKSASPTMTKNSEKLTLFYDEYSTICENILIKFWPRSVQTTESSKVPRAFACDGLTLNCCDPGVPKQNRKCPKDLLRQSFKALVGPRSRDKQRADRPALQRTIRYRIFSSTLMIVGQFALLEKFGFIKILKFLNCMHPWAEKFYFHILKFQTYTQYVKVKCVFEVIINLKNQK